MVIAAGDGIISERAVDGVDFSGSGRAAVVGVIVPGGGAGAVGQGVGAVVVWIPYPSLTGGGADGV